MSDDYSEQQLKAVLATADEWYELFAHSPEFARLSDSHQRKAGAITEFFAQYAYEYLGVSPNKWDRDAVEECCTEILPRKVSAEPPFFEAMAPVLSAFFGYLEGQSLLSQGRDLAKIVQGLHNEIVANSRDSSNWGLAKRFVMAASDAGVDIQDSAALQAFMVQFNLQQVARSALAGYQQPPWFSQAPLRKKQTVAPPGGRYDPCPCGSGKKYKFCCEPKG